ncbi:hypothetical protein TIFTF001_015723 [Ficus carica]|uniref:F-box domain-containing protein n=1 Tax=Ficus carica TaxID=3494 RepID=A0AA88A912_FICCA|nr:hypothetical protein TIFTF001_015723 [Ficus carica]
MADERQSPPLALDRSAMEASTSKFDNLPREIVAEIMSRLPPESLMGCKCLNKSWYFVIKCLIKDPKFVAKHLHQAEAAPETLVVYYRFLHLEELMTSLITSTSSRHNGDEDDLHLVSEDLSLPVYFTQQGYNKVHHCDGIICLTRDNKTITLCNLALREFCIFSPETDLVINEYSILGVGFGKDFRSGNYKIVRLLEPMKAEVFTPGTSNSWREIAIDVNSKHYEDVGDHAYLNGKCFWLMLGEPWTLLCFDLCTEVFQTISLPNGEDTCSSITIHDDLLCFFWYPLLTQFSNCIHVWKLDFKDGGSGTEDFTYSWRKCLETNPFERLYIPMTFWQSDELLVDDADNMELYYNPHTENSPESDEELLVDTEYARISSFNIRTRKLRKVKLPEYGTLGPILYKGPYVKSLVSIKEKKLA